MTALLNKINMSGYSPKDYLVVTVIALQKKNQAEKFRDHRTISLISHTPKIVTRIVSKSLEIKIEHLIKEATASKEISLNMGTWNVGTLRQAGRLENLTSNMDRFQINFE